MKHNHKSPLSLILIALMLILITACDFGTKTPNKNNNANISSHTIFGGAQVLPNNPESISLPELIISSIYINKDNDSIKFLSITNTSEKPILLKNYNIGLRKNMNETYIRDLPMIYLENNATLYILDKKSSERIYEEFPNIRKLSLASIGEMIPKDTSMRYTNIELPSGEMTYEIIQKPKQINTDISTPPIYTWTTIDIISLNGNWPVKGSSALRIYEPSSSKDYGWRILDQHSQTDMDVMNLQVNLSGGKYTAPEFPKYPNGTGGGTNEASPLSPDFIEKKTRQNNELGIPFYTGSKKLTEEQDFLISRACYTLSFNYERNIANWVCWHIDETDIGPIHYPRPESKEFKEDPFVVNKGWNAVNRTDYQFSKYGFERGHMCPNGDRKGNKQQQLDTFYMTNILPQVAENNEHAWADLEDDIRINYVDKGMEVYVVSGPSIQNGGSTIKVISKDPNKSHPGVYKEQITHERDGKTITIDVPAYTWKVIIAIPNGENDIERINANPEIAEVYAVWMPNSDKLCKNKTYNEFKVSIDFVEQMTGYDFFPSLDDAVENILESKNHQNNPKIMTVFSYEEPSLDLAV